MQNELRTEVEIMADWKGHSTSPKVSIACIAYNHASFIKDAMDGFLKQKTDFPFEIVVHDDASTDDTVDIIKSYKKKYPNIIRLIIQSENQYSQGRRPFLLLYPQLTGEYIAFCEGDDYWVDEYKLQKQVDFLDNNPDYVISGHDAKIVDANGNLIKESKLKPSQKKDHSADDLLLGRAWILTLSWVFRRVLKDDEAFSERSLVVNGDNFILSLLGQYGKGKYHDDIEPGVYRLHKKGVWGMLNKKIQARSHINTYLLIHRYYYRIGNSYASEFWWSRFEKAVADNMSASLLFSKLIKNIFNFNDLASKFKIKK